MTRIRRETWTSRSRRGATSRAAMLAAVLLIAGCDRTSVVDPPLVQSSLDFQLRALLQQWGAVPIGPVAPQNPALVDLGQSLFFDKLLSGNRDVACATCHDPTARLTDDLSLAIGTGGTGAGASRSLGAGRRFVPRNAPTLLNQGLGFFYTLWDGRVNEELGLGRFKAPAGIVFPAGLTNLIAAQAMLPVLNRTEMRGDRGDTDAFGSPNELAALGDSSYTLIWQGVMQRVLSVQQYAAKFAAAYPGMPSSALGFQHAANAIAAFQIQAFTRINSPFDRYLKRDDAAMTEQQKRGALLFFGKARCSQCHSGALLGGQQFANIGVPQLGPGFGAAAPLDAGRGEEIPTAPFYQFAFRVAPLRNVELTAPYMHNGAYRTLEAVVGHYTNADSAHRTYDVSQLDPALRATYHGDATSMNRVLANLDFRVRPRIEMTDIERQQIVAFLKSLTDPAARDLSAIIPSSVPSGLPIR